jgi:hypothetical protein
MMPPPPTQSEYLFFLLALFSEILGTISGFGSSILFVPLAAFFFPFQEVLGITALFHVFSNTAKLFLFRNGFNKHIVWRMGLSAVAAVLLGAALSKYAPIAQLDLALSAFMLVLSIYLLSGHHKSLQQTDVNLVGGGLISGFIAGLVGTGGAIRGIVLVAFELPKQVFIATSAWIDMGVDSGRLMVYWYNGYLKERMFWMIPVLILISLLGTWLGKQVLKRMPEALFQKMVLTLIIVIALVRIVDYVAGVFSA